MTRRQHYRDSFFVQTQHRHFSDWIHPIQISYEQVQYSNKMWRVAVSADNRMLASWRASTHESKMRFDAIEDFAHNFTGNMADAALARILRRLPLTRTELVKIQRKQRPDKTRGRKERTRAKERRIASAKRKNLFPPSVLPNESSRGNN